MTVQKISFVAPDETGKLKANQTGCIKVEVKNTNSNNALEVSCIVNEKNIGAYDEGIYMMKYNEVKIRKMN